MENVNWCYLPKDEEDEAQQKARPRVNENFRKMVHAISGKARVKILDHETENRLIAAWQTDGDRDALKKLVHAFDPMILGASQAISGRHKVPHLADEVYQEGQLSFIRGLRRYRIEDGNRLSTFIKYSVVGEMNYFAMCHRMPMRTGTSVGERKAYYRYRAAVDAFQANHGHFPGDSPADLAAISANLGVTPKAFKKARMTHTAKIVGFDQVQVWTEGLVGPEDISAVRKLLVEEFASLERLMTPRDAGIARSYLPRRGEKSALEEVAREHDLSVERIRQIARAALSHIRKSLEEKGFRQTDDVMSVG